MWGNNLQKEKAFGLKKAPLLSEHCCLSLSRKFVNSFLCIYLTLLFLDLPEPSVPTTCVQRGRASVLLGWYFWPVHRSLLGTWLPREDVEASPDPLISLPPLPPRRAALPCPQPRWPVEMPPGVPRAGGRLTARSAQFCLPRAWQDRDGL